MPSPTGRYRPPPRRWSGRPVCSRRTATPTHRFALASVTKPLVARAVQVAVEEGVVELDTAAGPPGSTVRHLLAHASGSVDALRASAWRRPGTRRMYSNYGFAVLAETVQQAVGDRIRPLSGRGGVRAARHGRPPARTAARRRRATARTSTVADLAAFAGDLLRPRRCRRDARRGDRGAVPGLDGVLPGFGVQRPNDWGLGFEIRDAKSPHWTGSANSAATLRTFRPVRARLSGSIPSATWRWWCSPTAISATGRYALWPAHLRRRIADRSNIELGLAQQGPHKAQ